MPAMKITRRYFVFRLAAAVLLLAGALGVALASAGATAQASNPATIPSHPPVPVGKAQPLENGPATIVAPWFTTAPSSPVAIDPHWRANVKANTDSTTF